MGTPKFIGESDFGANDGADIATHQVTLWLENEPNLMQRAQQIINQDQQDSSGLFPLWVEFMLFGSPGGKFNLNHEPSHDARVVMDLKQRINRDDFRRINWDAVRNSVAAN